LAARALLAQKPREAELAQLSANLLGRRSEPDDAELRLGRRRLHAAICAVSRPRSGARAESSENPAMTARPAMNAPKRSQLKGAEVRENGLKIN